MPMCSWAVVPARMMTMASTSRTTVSRSDASGARIFCRGDFLFTGFTKLEGLEERLVVAALVGHRLRGADQLDEPDFTALHEHRHVRALRARGVALAGSREVEHHGAGAGGR